MGALPTEAVKNGLTVQHRVYPRTAQHKVCFSTAQGLTQNSTAQGLSQYSIGSVPGLDEWFTASFPQGNGHFSVTSVEPLSLRRGTCFVTSSCTQEKSPSSVTSATMPVAVEMRSPATCEHTLVGTVHGVAGRPSGVAVWCRRAILSSGKYLWCMV